MVSNERVSAGDMLGALSELPGELAGEGAAQWANLQQASIPRSSAASARSGSTSRR